MSKYPVKYLIGEQHGQYTIVARWPDTSRSHYVKARCGVCEKEVEKNMSKLFGGHRGCRVTTDKIVHHTKGKRYIPGEIYGRYKILKRLPRSGRGIARDQRWLVECLECHEQMSRYPNAFLSAHKYCGEPLPTREEEPMIDDDNGGLGTTVLRVRKQGTKLGSDRVEDYADVLVDGDYDGEYFTELAPHMRVLHTGYVQISYWYPSATNNKNEYLHRLVAKPSKGMWVRFKNGNPTDCRTTNLEVVTPSFVARNRREKGTVSEAGKAWKSRQSKYRGVMKLGVGDLWQVRYRSEVLGLFENEVEAAKAYDRAKANHRGVDRQYMNFPEDYPKQPAPVALQAIIQEAEQISLTDRQEPVNDRGWKRKTQFMQCPRCGENKLIWKEAGVCPDCVKEVNERSR